MTPPAPYVIFLNDRLLFEGPLSGAALALRELSAQARGSALVFAFEHGGQLDLDVRGSVAEVVQRYPEAAGASESEEDAVTDAVSPPEPRKRGRPKLGVVGREVTLLPRHWAWLDSQRGGASASLRRLVDQARKELATVDRARRAQERSQRLLTALVGNATGFEEAMRALYAGNRDLFESLMESWPGDVQRIARSWSEDAFQA